MTGTTGTPTSSPTHLRVLLHAADRTGPPMLARGLLRSVRATHPELRVDVVTFRGGEMVAELEELGPVTVLLRDHEAWDHSEPDAVRVADLQAIGDSLERPDVVLLVSISGGQCLPYLPGQDGTVPVVSWVVEQGEDLHWLGPPVDVAARTDVWLAGSATTRDELIGLLGTGHPVEVVPEFVETPKVPSAAVVAARRADLRGSAGGLLVAGAGIATVRKAPDLFLEAAAVSHQRDYNDAFVWVGGTEDPLWPLVDDERRRLGLHRFLLAPSVPDLTPTLAAADVFLHPARLDAFPLVCLHAVLAGTPVVAFSGAGGVPEMLGDSFVGAPYPDLAGLVDQLDRLRDPGVRAQVAAAQLAYVAPRFTAEVAGEAVVNAVARAVSGRSASATTPEAAQ